MNKFGPNDQNYTLIALRITEIVQSGILKREHRLARELKPYFMVPFSRNCDYVSRGDILDQLKQKQMNGIERFALWGLGGVGYEFTNLRAAIIVADNLEKGKPKLH